jgi:hypothetical protein
LIFKYALQEAFLCRVISHSFFRFLGKEEEKGRRMAIFLVDLEFREKAKSLLTSRELAACVFLLLLALMPWSEVGFLPYNGRNLAFGSGSNRFWVWVLHSIPMWIWIQIWALPSV